MSPRSIYPQKQFVCSLPKKEEVNFIGRLHLYDGLGASDKDISDDEVGLIYTFGNDIGFSDKEISIKVAEMIQRNYVPSLESIC